MHFISSLDIKFEQSQWSMKGRSSAPGHGMCSKSVSSTIKLQGSYSKLYCTEIHYISRLNIKFFDKVGGAET